MADNSNIKIIFSAELFGQIIFGMENQDQEMVLDSVRSVVLSMDDAGMVDDDIPESAEERFLPLPEWGPARGFNLMESFVSQLHNPEAKKALKTALETKKGVFRNFKAALKDWPEFEKLWFAFKNKQMEIYIRAWYEDIEGTQVSEVEPEQDHSELILEDFEIRSGSDVSMEVFWDLDKRSFLENCIFSEEAYQTWSFQRRMDSVDIQSRQKHVVVGAFGPQNEPAGFFWAYLRFETESIREWEVLQIAVEPLWRGLGLASVLWEAGLKILKSKGVGRVVFSPGSRMNQLVKTRLFDGIKIETETFSFILDQDK